MMILFRINYQLKSLTLSTKKDRYVSSALIGLLICDRAAVGNPDGNLYCCLVWHNIAYITAKNSEGDTLRKHKI
jgi:hypothetical protein